MSRTFRDRAAARRWSKHAEEFRCRHCKVMVFPPPSGGRHRNHCPYCLWSRHVDGRVPGDRASECGSMMEPVGSFVRENGEQAVVHRCRGCDLDRHCRVAADDDLVGVMRLPLLAPSYGAPVRVPSRAPSASPA